MGYKKNDPCLKKAFDEERLFVLMTRDKMAPLAVLEWIKQSFHSQSNDKLREAFECALEMKNNQSYFNEKKTLLEIDEMCAVGQTEKNKD